MRKKALKKNNSFRHEAFKKIREVKNSLETIILNNGTEMIINPVKKFLLQKQYINPELKNHIFRKFTNYVNSQNTKSSVSASVQVEVNE